MADAALDLDQDDTTAAQALQRFANNEQEEEASFADAEEDSFLDAALKPDPDANLQPAFGSEAWNDYVMRQFTDSELKDGAPTCDGCRRVFEQLVGVILECTIPSYVGPTNDNKGTATVVVGMDVLITNDTHPAIGRTIRIQEIADVNDNNTDAPYNRHPSATAATRAEGRGLRKLLRLRNVITAEEKSEAAEQDTDDKWEPDEPITDSQIGVIDMLCGADRLNINVVEFINSGRKAYANIRDVTKSTAQRMIQELNKIQREAKPKPPGLHTYVSNWQNIK